MKKIDLAKLSVNQLVAHFVDLCLVQDEALYGGPVERYNNAFRAMADVVNELKSRPGDQRLALVPLFDHQNLQVRLKAARAVYAIVPAARAVMEEIANSNRFPYAGHAGMALLAIDRGISTPG